MHPAMFHELREGVVRLDPDLADLLASTLMLWFAKVALDIANAYAEQLRRITVPRRPFGGAEADSRAPSLWERSACGCCKEPLPPKGSKFLREDCYLRYSVEVAKPIEKAQARLVELRAQGSVRVTAERRQKSAAQRSPKIIDVALLGAAVKAQSR